MERRKIQKVGHSTLSVSLPKDWVNLQGIKQGNTVYLEQAHNGSLLIVSDNSLQESRKPKEYSINCDLAKERNMLERLIVGSYMQGVDTIRLFSSMRINGKQIEEIRNIVRRLVGISIIEMSKNEVILQCFIDPMKFDMQSLVQRLSVITSTMLIEAIESLIKFDSDLAMDVIKREDEANNIHWLITRLCISDSKLQNLNDKSLNGFLNATDIRLISKNLERIADCSEIIAKVAIDLHRVMDTIDTSELEKLSSLRKMTVEIFQKAVHSLFSRDIIVANDVLNLWKELDAEVDDLMRTAIIPYSSAIAVMLFMIAENSASIAAVSINIEIQKANSFP